MVGYLCHGPVTDDRCRLCVRGRHPVCTRDDRWFCTSSLRHMPHPKMQDIYKARTQIEMIYASPSLTYGCNLSILNSGASTCRKSRFEKQMNSTYKLGHSPCATEFGASGTPASALQVSSVTDVTGLARRHSMSAIARWFLVTTKTTPFQAVSHQRPRHHNDRSRLFQLQPLQCLKACGGSPQSSSFIHLNPLASAPLLRT